MADEVKSPSGTPRVAPSNPTRGAGRRQRPPRRPAADPTRERRRETPDDDRPHRIDDYA